MSDFIPTTNDVRQQIQDGIRSSGAIDADMFDLWYSAARDDARSRAWDEACEAFAWALDNGTVDGAVAYVAVNNPYRVQERENVRPEGSPDE